MAMEPGDLSSLQVEMDLARRPPAPAAAPAPGPGPEIVEEVAEEAAGAVGGGSVGPPVAATAYPGIQDMSVHLAPPGFTVCESFFDSGVFTCFNPEVVFGTEVRLLPNGSFSMGDDVWCNVTIEDGRIESAELATAADDGATVSVHVADIRPDGVKQYHVGAIVVNSGGGEGDDVPTPFEYVERAGSILYRDFYWDGVLVYAEPEPGFAIPANGDVYLKCVGTLNTSAPGADANGYVWAFTIGTTPATASGSQKVFNFKLYSFFDGEVDVDWRDTFLALWSGIGGDVEPDGVSVDKIPDAAPGTTPTGDEGKLQVKGFVDAPLGTVPIAVRDGGTKKLGWGTTGNFGITATKNGANWIYTVDGGYFTRARTQTYVSGITVSTSGYVYLKVPLGTGGSASIVLESTTKTSDSSYTYILLYYCNVSMGVADYRGAPHIQVWE